MFENYVKFQKKKINNIQYMYDGCFKINVKFKKNNNI